MNELVNMFDCQVGYTVTTPQGHTVEAMTSEELCEDFPDMYYEAQTAIDDLYMGVKRPEYIVRAHFILPLIVV